MSLIPQIDNDLIEALRAKSELTLATLRLLKSEIKNAAIAIGKELNDEEVIAVIQRGIKQRQDAIIQYNKANRPELANKEQAEITILTKYLPPQLSDDELSQIIADTKKQINASSSHDFGKIMGAIMPKVKGRADGNRIANLVRESFNDT